jgi:hypothetical protein
MSAVEEKVVKLRWRAIEAERAKIIISIIPQTFALPKTDVQLQTHLEPSNGN